VSDTYDVEKGDEDDEMYDELDDNLLKEKTDNQEPKFFDTEKE
jgi:hypothetical protein